MASRGQPHHLLPIAAAATKWLQSCPTLCDPIDGSSPGSPVPGILQARTLEWVAISFSIAWKWEVKVKSLSRVRLLATPCTAAYQAPPSMGFSRREYWSGVPVHWVCSKGESSSPPWNPDMLESQLKIHPALTQHFPPSFSKMFTVGGKSLATIACGSRNTAFGWGTWLIGYIYSPTLPTPHPSLRMLRSTCWAIETTHTHTSHPFPPHRASE